MIIIYDFDGTLTPYALPQYEILRQSGYTDESLMKRISTEIKNSNSVGLYDSYYKCYRDILRENGIVMSRDNICLGANRVQFNSGVVEYFRRFQSSKTGVKHYIVTSGIKDYVEETAISEFVNGPVRRSPRCPAGIHYRSVSALIFPHQVEISPERERFLLILIFPVVGTTYG